MTVTPLAKLPAKLDRLTKSVERGRQDTLIDVAVFAKGEFLAGPPRVGLRKGAKLAGRKWTARFDLTNGHDPSAIVKYRGPVHWFDKGTDDHLIQPRKRRRKKAISFNGLARASARHPGMKARPFYGGVKRRVETGAPKIAQANLRRNVARAGFGAAADIRRTIR